MRSELVTKVGSCGVDNLIAKLTPTAETFGVKVAAGSGVLPRGTLLGVNSSGKMEVYGAAEEKSQKFSGDGTTKKFTVTAQPAALTSVKVGDTAVDAADYTYTADTGELSFATAPASGTNNVVVSYSERNTGNLSVNCILADDVDASGETDATAVAYRSGNFNRKAVILPTGYTLSAADEDALRKYDIIFTDPM